LGLPPSQIPFSLDLLTHYQVLLIAASQYPCFISSLHPLPSCLWLLIPRSWEWTPSWFLQNWSSCDFFDQNFLIICLCLRKKRILWLLGIKSLVWKHNSSCGVGDKRVHIQISYKYCVMKNYIYSSEHYDLQDTIINEKLNFVIVYFQG
jgi:hypothetical protein